MAEDSGEGVLAFLLGGALGAAAGLLLAPRSGEETREAVLDWLEKNRERTEEFLEKERETIHHKKDQISAAYEAGKKAYREGA